MSRKGQRKDKGQRKGHYQEDEGHEEIMMKTKGPPRRGLQVSETTVEIVDTADGRTQWDEVDGKEVNPLVVVCAHCIVPGPEEKDFLSRYRWCPPPLSMFIISLSQIIVFIVYAVELANNGTPVTAMSGVPTYSPLIYKADRRYEAWRFITYMFIHIGYLHLTFNVIIQLVLGVPLEWVHSWWRVPIIYLIGVISGSLAHSLTDHAVDLAGASGGGYALIGAHLAAVVTNWKEMNYKCWDGRFCRMLLSAPVRLSVVLATALADTGMALYKRFGEGSHQIGVSAHIGGLLAGLLIGVPFLKNINVKPWEKTVGWVTLIVYLLCFVAVLLFNGFYKGYPPTDWSPCCH
ncbi:rhomboid-related protein 2-like [Liolophura sinensis]|uniref:rhomboid-related protein 2-like n=1 Tax=Liolophura sinensis TaxID=3198878 RepID=UPI003158BC4A